MIENLRLSAHRGAVTVAPENTLESIQSAIDLKYGAIEIDPRVTLDGEIFLMHDDTVDRTTNGSGTIDSMTSDQIKALKINTENYPKYQDKILRVPTLDESVATASTGDLVINLDGAKVDWSNASFTNKIVNILKRNKVYEKTFFVITNKIQRESFVKNNPDACVSWLEKSVSGLAEAISEVKSYKRAMLSIPVSIATDEVLSQLRNSGIYYQVYLVEKSADYERLKAKRVRMIETDSLLP